MDLVDAAALQVLSAATDAREVRVAALQELAHSVAAGASGDWTDLRDRARAAMRLPVPDAPDIEVIEAWGCPRCGRIDAPQPCIGVCIRGPGSVADAREYRQLAPRAQRVAAADEALSGLARLIAAVTPRPGREDATLAALRPRARDVLEQVSGEARATSRAAERQEGGAV